MMVMGDIFCDFHKIIVLHTPKNVLNSFGTLCSMSLHDSKFFIRIFPWFAKNLIVDCNLSQIMHRSCLCNTFQKCLIKAKLTTILFQLL